MGVAPARDDRTRPESAKLKKVIETPDDPFRNYLTGPLGARLFALLDEVARDNREIFAALYELEDEQLEAALEKIGQRAHVVLANGSVEEKRARTRTARPGSGCDEKIDLHDRMTSPAGTRA